jgi:L-ascorbate metabolism protein UlaG (beta-lactamase superfamily)
MQVTYYAHSTFHIHGDDGANILIDPYAAGSYLRYDATFDPADIVCVTHEHGDHNNVDAVPGNPEVVRGPGSQTVKGRTFTGIPSFHDREQGAKRGPINMMVFEVDGMRVAHLSDLGTELSDEQYDQLSGVNVMFAAIGGGPTLEPENVWALVKRVGPNILIPAHFKTDKIDLPVITVDEFLEGKPSVRRTDSSTVEIRADNLPEPTEIVVLDPSR